MEKQKNVEDETRMTWSAIKDESTVWTSDIDFWIDRMASFQAILNKTVSQNLAADALKQVDHLQNIVTFYSRELLMDLKSKVFHYREQIELAIKKGATPEAALLAQHKSIAQEMDSTEKAIATYAQEFSELEKNRLQLDNMPINSIERILIPVDFSANSQRATDYALSLLGKQLHEIVLLNVFHSPFKSNGDSSIINEEDSNEEEELFESEKLRLGLAFPTLTDKITCRYEVGFLNEKIKEVVAEQKIDLLVMGTKGSSGMSSFLFGSNTSKVIKSVAKPTLIVPLEAPLLPPDRLMLALDLHLDKKPPHFDILTTIRKKYSSTLDVLHIESPEESAHSVHDKVHEENILSILSLNDVQVHRIVSEQIKKSINQQVAQRSIDLLCVIEHKHGWLYHALGKSVTVQMVLDTHIPLLVLHLE